MKDEEARKLAAEIAKDLFTNTDRDRAKRLVIESEYGRRLGAWSEEAVIARLTRWIQAPRKVRKP